MQELMQWMEETEFMVNKGFIDKVHECLEKEKEQIIEAYNSKINEHLFAPITSINKMNGEEYYNQNYNK